MNTVNRHSKQQGFVIYSALFSVIAATGGTIAALENLSREQQSTQQVAQKQQQSPVTSKNSVDDNFWDGYED